MKIHKFNHMIRHKHIIVVFLLLIFPFKVISQEHIWVLNIHKGEEVVSYELPEDADGFKVQKVEYTSVPSGYENGYEYIDMGLPSGTKWATCNLGATTPLESGNHYAWGESESEPSLKYDWETYRYCICGDQALSEPETLTKYCLDSSYGEVDGLQYLEPSDDPVSVAMGGRWRMPTVEQYEELGMNCDFIRGVVDGVYGVAIISRINGASMFAPAAGIYLSEIYVHPSIIPDVEYIGAYWATKLDENNSQNAYVGFFSETQINMTTIFRCMGLSLRGACIINE